MYLYVFIISMYMYVYNDNHNLKYFFIYPKLPTIGITNLTILFTYYILIIPLLL